MELNKDFTVDPLRLDWKRGHNVSKSRGQRGKDRKPRRMHPNSLKNLRWNKRESQNQN